MPRGSSQIDWLHVSSGIWRNLVGGVSLALVISYAASGWAQLEGDKPPVPKGAEQITESRVAATISFLASDELGGRGTGTPEFNIAAAYVASRFRAAGLEGGGTEGSFYHETVTSQVRTPSQVVVESKDKVPVANGGLLAAVDEKITFEGSVGTVALESIKDQESVPKDIAPVVRGSFATTAKGSRALSQLSRIASLLSAAGVKILLLDVDADSEWYKQGGLSRVKPRMESSNRFAIPIILVAPTTQLPEAVRLVVPPLIREQQTMRNVIGVLRGRDPQASSEAILFSAHLDHLGSNPKMEGDNIYNGADDDASGVTAVVTLADAFAAMSERPKRSLVFMAFWGEESGLLGSKQFVATPSWPLEKIIANVNIEMIGRPEGGARGKIWMTGWQESNLGVLMNDSSKRWGVDIFEHPKFSSMLYRASDNWSFVEKGVVAHSFSAGSLHEDYHQVDDEWDRLEIPHMTSVIRGLMLGSLPLIDGSATPAKTASK
ncbi:MAG: M28 family peptidase [Planctomycetes bacterium]|nr:M28 family peptidase [Planctomycetota bacterium]